MNHIHSLQELRSISASAAAPRLRTACDYARAQYSMAKVININSLVPSPPHTHTLTHTNTHTLSLSLLLPLSHTHTHTQRLHLVSQV